MSNVWYEAITQLTSSVCGRNVGAVPLRITGAAPSSETEKEPWLEDVAPYKLIAFPVK
jgi:hypothetical protein